MKVSVCVLLQSYADIAIFSGSFHEQLIRAEIAQHWLTKRHSRL